jgi:hypothetical protein
LAAINRSKRGVWSATPLSNAKSNEMTAAHRSLLATLALVWVAAAAGAGASREHEQAVFDPPLGSGKILLSEDFESTPAGEIPQGFTKTGVVDDVAHSGKKSLRMEAAANGARRITLKGGNCFAHRA